VASGNTDDNLTLDLPASNAAAKGKIVLLLLLDDSVFVVFIVTNSAGKATITARTY
jgi:hypothetical protein